MGLAANPIPAVVLLLSLLAAAPPVSAKLKNSTIPFNDFNSNTQKLHFAGNSSLGKGALQLTVDTENTFPASTNNYGRVLYHKSFKLWEGQNDSDRVASFNTSFLVNLNQKTNFSTPGEGLAFVVAPDLKIPLNSSGGYLGLTSSTTDGNVSNQIIAIELDTFKDYFDPDSNHVGLNINSVISHKTTSLTSPEFELVAPVGTPHFFNVWIEYDGINKVLWVWTRGTISVATLARTVVVARTRRRAGRVVCRFGALVDFSSIHSDFRWEVKISIGWFSLGVNREYIQVGRPQNCKLMGIRGTC